MRGHNALGWCEVESVECVHACSWSSCIKPPGKQTGCCILSTFCSCSGPRLLKEVVWRSGVLGHASAFSPKKLAQFFARALACRVRPVDCLVMGDDFDALDFDHDKDFESLPCDLNYAVVCLILPALNGLLNGFLWPAYTLYFQENGWPVVRAGLAQGLGFCFRVLTQQMQLAAGYWLIVPLAVIHLTFAVLGLIYFDQEWAVFAEILVVFTIDPTCAIEGLAFDTFGNSEVQARQAASTSLSVYTICVASACTIGGIAYDFFSWKGTATFHTICQSLLLFMLAIQPSMRQSFMEVWFPAKEPEKIEEDQEENSKRAPNTPNTDAASGAEVTKVAFAEKLEEDQEENSTRTLNTYAASGAEVANLTFSENFEEYQMESSTRTLNTYAASGAEVANLTFSENFEEYQVESSTRTPNKDAASGANGALWAVLPGVVQEDNPPADLVLESLEVGEDKADALKKHLSITSAGGRGSRTSRNRRNFVSGKLHCYLGHLGNSIDCQNSVHCHVSYDSLVRSWPRFSPPLWNKLGDDASHCGPHWCKTCAARWRWIFWWGWQLQGENTCNHRDRWNQGSLKDSKRYTASSILDRAELLHQHSHICHRVLHFCTFLQGSAQLEWSNSGKFGPDSWRCCGCTDDAGDSLSDARWVWSRWSGPM